MPNICPAGSGRSRDGRAAGGACTIGPCPVRGIPLGDGQPWAEAVALRCHVLLGHEPEGSFERALRLHAAGSRPFERARTELAYGRWLRRDRRRLDARVQLDSALAIFSRLGATPWAEQARGELRATGATTVAQAAGAGLVARLTAQELQVVRRAAASLSNREIAAELFLSPRTVACQPQLARRLIRRGSRWSSVVFMSGTVTGNLIRLVLSGAERQGADPRVLVREAGCPAGRSRTRMSGSRPRDWPGCGR